MWLVVLTILKRRVRQWEGLSHILWQIIQMFKPPSRNSQNPTSYPKRGWNICPTPTDDHFASKVAWK